MSVRTAWTMDQVGNLCRGCSLPNEDIDHVVTMFGCHKGCDDNDKMRVTMLSDFIIPTISGDGFASKFSLMMDNYTTAAITRRFVLDCIRW